MSSTMEIEQINALLKNWFNRIR